MEIPSVVSRVKSYGLALHDNLSFACQLFNAAIKDGLFCCYMPMHFVFLTLQRAQIKFFFLYTCLNKIKRKKC